MRDGGKACCFVAYIVFQDDVFRDAFADPGNIAVFGRPALRCAHSSTSSEAFDGNEA